MTEDRPQLKKGYDWKISVKKGLTPAFSAGVSAFIVAFAVGLDVEALTTVGLPATVAPFVVIALKNWAKNKHR